MSFYEDLVEAIDFIPNPRVVAQGPDPLGPIPAAGTADWEANSTDPTPA